MAAQSAIEETARAGAESVYRYLERTAEAGPDGVRWQTLSFQNQPWYAASLYTGVAGVTLFLSDYYRLTGVPTARDLARGALAWCSLPEPTRWPAGPTVPGSGLHSGRTGLGLAWLRFALATGDSAALGPAVAVGDELLRAAPGPHTSLVFGAAGEGVFLLRLWAAAGDERYLAGAARFGEWLDRAAVRDAAGCHWPRQLGSVPRPNLHWHWTGVASGAAGIGHFLLELSQATGTARWAALAREVAATLTGQARGGGGAVTWPATFAAFGGPEPEPGRWRWGWCTGAPGIGRFYVRAAEVLGDAALLETAETAGEGVWAHRDWRRNPSHCHGLAGSADLFLALAHRTGVPVWRERAGDVARRALACRATTAGGDAWPADDADDANAAGLYSPDFAYGAAGVGHFFLRVLAPERVPPVFA